MYADKCLRMQAACATPCWSGHCAKGYAKKKEPATGKVRRYENGICLTPEVKSSFVNTRQQPLTVPGQSAGLSS